jgi:hypothetical protein
MKLLISIVSILLAIQTATPALAQEGTPTPDAGPSRSFLFHPADAGVLGVFMASIAAGESGELTVLVGNNGTLKQDIRVYPVNVFTGENGGMAVADYGAPPNAVTQWLQFTEEVFSFEPGEGVEIKFQVNVPAGTPPGEYIAAVAGEHADSSEIEGEVSFRQKLRYIAPIFITVPGDMSAAFSIGEPVTEPTSDGLLIEVPINNDGDMHITPQGSITLRDENGAVIGTIPVGMQTVFARESAMLTIGIPGGLPPGHYQLEGTLSDAETGATATIEHGAFEVLILATPEAIQYSFRNTTATAGPAADNVQFVTVDTTVLNNGDPSTGVQLSLIAFLDGEEVERFPINQSLSLPTGETPITTRYIPATGFTTGEWTFELLLETVTPGGAAVVAARIEIETTIEVP